MQSRGGAWGPGWAHAIVAVALWPIPLVGMLHVEGAAVAAFASFFIAGVASIGAFERGDGTPVVVRRHLGLLVIPVALLSATALWRPNCGYLLGLGLFALMVPPSVLLAVGLADCAASFRVPRPRTWFVVSALLLAAVPSALLLKLRPQLFVYNPVFGGVLGPLYDIELAIRPGFFAHQAAVVVAAVGFAGAAAWRRGSRRGGRLARSCVSVIAFVAGFSAPLGITQSEGGIRRSLSATASSDHVSLHFVPGSITSARADDLLDEAEFRLWQIEEALGISLSERVDVYLYPDPQTKAALLGSRETSVVPVWLPSPQVHLLDSRADGDLGHELVHVAAREVGGAVTGATWAVGLVEGLAVALEPPEGLPSPEQLTAAALDLPPERGGVRDPALAVTGAMDPFGFWTGRAGASYTTTGAFVGWLLERFGPEPVLRVYAGESWVEAFGSPLRDLASSWSESLRSVEVSPEAVEFAAWRFGLPSLFETRCPHHLPRWRRLVREAGDEFDRGDLVGAAMILDVARSATEDSLARTIILSRLAFTRALVGRAVASEVDQATRLLTADTSGALLQARLDLAHAASLQGLEGDYEEAIESLPLYAVQTRALVRLGSDLDEEALRSYLHPAADSARALRLGEALATRGATARFLAAFRFHEAGHPRFAWRAIESSLPDLDVRQVDRAALDLLAARAAYRADDLPAADSLSAAAARVFQTAGSAASARQAFDLRERIAWRRTRAR